MQPPQPQEPTEPSEILQPDITLPEGQLVYKELKEVFGEGEKLDLFYDAVIYILRQELGITSSEIYVFLALLSSLITTYNNANIEVSNDDLLHEVLDFMVANFPNLVRRFGVDYFQHCANTASDFGWLIDETSDYLQDNLEINASTPNEGI